MAAPPVKNVLLVGLGSMGTAYGYMIEKSGLARVTAVARSNYEAFQNREVTIDSDRFGRIEGWKPYRVFRTQEEALADGTQYDLGVVSTKLLPDIITNSQLLAPAIKSGQVKAWSILQNGLGIEKELYDTVNPAGTAPEHVTPVVSSCSWIFITPSPDGTYIRWPNADITVTGVYPPRSAEREFSPREEEAIRLWAALIGDAQDPKNTVVVTDRIDAVRYSKVGRKGKRPLTAQNIWNCAWATIQALVGVTVSALKTLTPEEYAPLREISREIIAVGYETGLLYEGQTLYPSGAQLRSAAEAVAMVFDGIITASDDHFFHNYKMSMFVDVEFDRPVEVEVIVGGVLRTAREAGIPTPALDLVYALLKGRQAGILARQEARRRAAAGGAKAAGGAGAANGVNGAGGKA